MGSKFPRVTEILRAVGLGPDLSMVRADLLDQARARGAAVHALVEAHHYGYLNGDEGMAHVAPYFEAYRTFLAESKYETIACELEVVHQAWEYCGHLDLIGWLLGQRTIIDIKTGEVTGGAYQVAAYCDAWTAERPTESVKAGALLELRPDATYRFTEVEVAPALEVFRAARIVYRARHS